MYFHIYTIFEVEYLHIVWTESWFLLATKLMHNWFQLYSLISRQVASLNHWVHATCYSLLLLSSTFGHAHTTISYKMFTGEPHLPGKAGHPLCMYLFLIRVSMSEPHTSELAGGFSTCIYMYVCTVRTWFRMSISCPICARCEYFHIACMLVNVNHCCTRLVKRLAGQKSWTVGANVTGAWKRWGKGGTTIARRRLIINVLRDTAANGECTERLACEDPNQTSVWLDQTTLVSNS